MVTNQQVFNHIASHLIQQNKQSVDRIGGCSYRGVGGLMCAVGCIIHDDVYQRGFEGITMHSVDILNAVRDSAPLIFGDTIPPENQDDFADVSFHELLVKLQHLHDNTKENFEDKLKAFVANHGEDLNIKWEL